MKTRLTERDINRIVKRIVNEDNDFVTGVAASKRTELVDDVINSDFPVEKYKRQDRPRRSDFELPKGVKVSKSIFPED